MVKRSRHAKPPGKRRTTLTLPTDSLKQAERIARTRNVNLSTVVAEALSKGLRLTTAADRGKQVLRSYRLPFAGFSDDEIAILDGVILEPMHGSTSTARATRFTSQR